MVMGIENQPHSVQQHCARRAICPHTNQLDLVQEVRRHEAIMSRIDRMLKSLSESDRTVEMLDIVAQVNCCVARAEMQLSGRLAAAKIETALQGGATVSEAIRTGLTIINALD